MKVVKLASLLFACLAFLGGPFSLCEEQFTSQPIVIYGDTRTGHRAHRRLVDAIVKIRPVAAFHTGDLVEDGTSPKDWAIFNKITSRLIKIAKFYPALGNHEGSSQLYFDNFDLPNSEGWYSVEINDIHFIVLDSNSDCNKGSEQYKWLEADLQKIDGGIKFVIVIFHHPPFSSGPHVEDEEMPMQTIVPLIEQYGADAVFNGHFHAYERSLQNGIYYIVSGGGGAPLHDRTRTTPYSQVLVRTYHFCRLLVKGDRLFIDVFDSDLNLIDQFTIESKRTATALNKRYTYVSKIF